MQSFFQIMCLAAVGVLTPTALLCQYDSVICTGFVNTTLDFRGDSIIIKTPINPYLKSNAGSASIYLPQKGYSLYTSGRFIVNSQGDTIVNSQLMYSNSFLSKYPNGAEHFKGTLLLPKSNHEVYIIYQSQDIFAINSASDIPNQLFYGVIDLSVGTQGTLISYNNLLLKENLTFGHITACPHANGRDWWLVQKDVFGKTYHSFILNQIPF